MSQANAVMGSTANAVSEPTLHDSSSGGTAGMDVGAFVKAMADAEAETERLRDALADADIRCPPEVGDISADGQRSSDSALSSWAGLADAFQFDTLRSSFFDTAVAWSGATGDCWQKCL